jgi:hypothetical protein
MSGIEPALIGGIGLVSMSGIGPVIINTRNKTNYTPGIESAPMLREED